MERFAVKVGRLNMCENLTIRLESGTPAKIADQTHTFPTPSKQLYVIRVPSQQVRGIRRTYGRVYRYKRRKKPTSSSTILGSTIIVSNPLRTCIVDALHKTSSKKKNEKSRHSHEIIYKCDKTPALQARMAFQNDAYLSRRTRQKKSKTKSTTIRTC